MTDISYAQSKQNPKDETQQYEHFNREYIRHVTYMADPLSQNINGDSVTGATVVSEIIFGIFAPVAV